VGKNGEDAVEIKYRGFREESLLAVVRELEGLDLKPSEIYAILNLAGAKWRSVQIGKDRGEDVQDEEDSLVFHAATILIMNSTMTENVQLVQLGHASDGERFMLLAISLAMAKLFSSGPSLIRRWLRGGDKKTRRIILAFAIGSNIVVEPKSIDLLVRRIVKSRYGVPFDAGMDISETVIELIDRLGNSGYSCLNPIEDTIE